MYYFFKMYLFEIFIGMLYDRKVVKSFWYLFPLPSRRCSVLLYRMFFNANASALLNKLARPHVCSRPSDRHVRIILFRGLVLLHPVFVHADRIKRLQRNPCLYRSRKFAGKFYHVDNGSNLTNRGAGVYFRSS